MEHVWDWFLQLSGQRSGNGFGGNPIGYAEIEAFCRLKRVTMRPWHVEAIVQMDGQFLAASAPDPADGSTPKPKDMQPADPASLREVFRRMSKAPARGGAGSKSSRRPARRQQ